MKPGRNDPCPCGSGKKYKNCCARVDAAGSPTLRLLGHDTTSEMEAQTMMAIARRTPWEADVTPVPFSLESEGNARPAAVIIAAAGLAVHVELVTHPPSDAAGVATLISDAIGKLLSRGGALPTAVSVRHAEVQALLAPMLKQRGDVDVVALPVLDTIDDFAGGLRQQMVGSRDRLPALSNPQMWAAWNLPANTVRDIFSAAAAFYVAAPWRVVSDDSPLELVMPNGSHWFACVLGNAGELFGLELLERLDDYLALTSSEDPTEAMAATRNVVLSFTFDTRADLGRPMRREIADAGWAVAGPSAYPSMYAINTIGGGVTEAQARDLVTALEVVARFGNAFSDAIVDGAPPFPDQWTDEMSGTTVAWALPLVLDPLWEVPELLSPALPQGARARASAHSRNDADEGAPSADDLARLARFVEVSHASGANRKRTEKDRQDVELFINVMSGHQNVDLASFTELDLRQYLYDLLPRKAMTTKSHANAMRSSLTRFFAYLAASEEIHYPWAAAILRDKFAFEERWDTFPHGHWWDAEVQHWMLEVTEDLYARVMLPEPSLAGVGEWGETMGLDEAMLHAELQREWLVWRDAEIAAGIQRPVALHEKLAARQAEWEQAPHQRYGGKSPADVIAHERKQTARAKPRTTRPRRPRS